MAIVPDKSGVRPGRAGNLPMVDPRNVSTKERMGQRDGYKESRVILVNGTNRLCIADRTRNVLQFSVPEGQQSIHLSQSAQSGAYGIPCYAGDTLTLRDEAAQREWWCWALLNVVGTDSVTVLAG